MNESIEQMLQQYNISSIYDRKNAMKEIIQEIVLCGLSRAGFFEKAAFYGGTALRIFYGLDRFSEDLDFSLTECDPSFNLSEYIPAVEKEVNSYGLNMEVSVKVKTKDSAIHSAFVKGSTQEHMLLFYGKNTADRIASNEVIKIKFEVDTMPPCYASYENRYRLLPTPYQIRLYDISSLFAGKIHAVVARSWQNRIKGRDLYDYVFYITKNAKVNIKHLRARLIDSGHITENSEFDINILKEMLFARFDSIDYSQAAEDVLPFIHNTDSVRLWSAEFFKQVTENLQGI